MKVALEELRLIAHELAHEKKYSEAVDTLLEIKKKTKVYSWDVAFYIAYYQILEESQLKDRIELLKIMNSAMIESISIIAIHLDGTERTMAPFEVVYEKVKFLAEKLLSSAEKEFSEYIETYKLSNKQKLIRKEEYVSQLESVLSLSETYINCMGNLVEFIPVNTEFMWNFFKFNDKILCKILPYSRGEGKTNWEVKRNEIIQIIHLKYADYVPCIVDTPILQDEKNKWWQFHKS